MQIPTHILSGWCVANCSPTLRARDRLFAMLAASLPDLDGLSIVFGERAFQTYHHLLTHSLPFAIVLSIIFAIVTAGSLARRCAMFALCVAMVHLHLLMDYIGSGPYWPIYYFWPFDQQFKFINKTGWPLFSWQNLLVFALLFIWTIVIALRCRRTPIELLAPRVDAMWVARLQRGIIRR